MKMILVKGAAILALAALIGVGIGLFTTRDCSSNLVEAPNQTPSVTTSVTKTNSHRVDVVYHAEVVIEGK